MSLSVVLDMIVVVMLGVTIYYAAVLKGRLATLRSDETEMQAELAAFSDAAGKAEASLANAKGRISVAEAGTITADGAAILAKGKEVSDDLNFLIERGDALANRLVDLVREARVAAATPERGRVFGDTIGGADPVGSLPRLLRPDAVFQDVGKTPTPRQNVAGIEVTPDPAPALSTAEKALMNKLRAVR